LYLAEDYENAYREKFQRKSSQTVDGLKAEELALQNGRSHSTVLLQGLMDRAFDMTVPRNLDAVASVLKKIRMPARVRVLKKKLRLKPDGHIQDPERPESLQRGADAQLANATRTVRIARPPPCFGGTCPSGQV
jgi:hypothetical protein